MPRRTTKPYKLEIELERRPLKPGEERRLFRLATKRAPGEIEKWNLARTDEERFYAAPRAALAAFNLSHHQVAQELAEKALALAPAFETNWNYGNAVHLAHTVVGLLALRAGEHSQAAAELQLSGAIQGSPQLNSFGPSMRLARALLRVGEFGPVLQYLKQCRAFWHMGVAWLDVWEKKVQRGVVPNFFMHIYR
jgi:tetratricopeptide (TPR) repeat protein